MKTTKIILSIALFAATCFPQFGAFKGACQNVGINLSGSSANSRSLLDLDANGLGLLIPRMTTAVRDTIGTAGPAIPEGLQIFNTTTKCFEAYVYGGWYALGCPAPCSPPAVPTANAASSIGCSSFTANWSASTGATSYYLDVSTNSGFSSFVTGYNNLNVGNVTSYSVTGLAAGTTYYYRLRATTACVSGNSGSINPTTTSAPSSAPTAATHTPSQIQIVWNWNTVIGATGYKWSLTNNYAGATDNGSSTTHTQTGLTCNTAYTLYVWAYSTCGNSSANTLIQSTSACSITFNYTGGQQTWDVPTGVTSITIDAYGAAGGGFVSSYGGYGGETKATISVTPGQTLYIFVGGAGGAITGTGQPAGIGGYNGGADGSGISDWGGASGGGGASDVRQGGTALSNRVVIAGGGGGSGTGGFYGSSGGGGNTGSDGSGGESTHTGGYGGTQSAGGAGGLGSTYCSNHGSPGSSGSLGAGGVGGDGTLGGSSGAGGGGGGGYYGGGGGGGGGGGSTSCGGIPGGAGAGGSGYTSGTLLLSSNGVQGGNGQIIITW